MFTSWSHFLNSSVIILIIILSKKFKRFLVWKFFTMVVFKKVTVNNVCWIFFLVWHWCEQGEFLRPDCPRHRQLLHYLQSSQRSQASTERQVTAYTTAYVIAYFTAYFTAYLQLTYWLNCLKHYVQWTGHKKSQ